MGPVEARELMPSELGSRVGKGGPSRPGISVSDVDFVTALCSQVVYEGLVDDTFRIKCGKWHLGEVEGVLSSRGLPQGAGLVGEPQTRNKLLASG